MVQLMFNFATQQLGKDYLELSKNGIFKTKLSQVATWSIFISEWAEKIKIREMKDEVGFALGQTNKSNRLTNICDFRVALRRKLLS